MTDSTLPERFSFVEKLSFFPDTVQHILAANPVGALSVVYLDLNTDICNHSCHFCDGFHRPLNANVFTMERLMRLADEFDELGVQAVVIAGDRGEPLMHPGAAEVIARLARSDIAVGIYTNGTVLSRRVRDVLHSVTWLRVSADSGSALTHERMHSYPSGRNDFDRLLKNLGSFSQHVPDLGCSFILDPLNIHEIELAAEVLLTAGAGFIEYKPKYLPNYAIDAAWLEASREILDASLTTVRRRWGDRVVISPQVGWLLHDQDVPTLTVPARQCRTSLLRMVISTHGCYPCTPHRGVADRRLGDINTQTLREVLHSAQRRWQTERTCDLMCAYHMQNEFLLGLNKSDVRLQPPERRMIPQDKFV